MIRENKKIIFGVQDGSLGDAVNLLPVVNQSNFTLQTDNYNTRYQIFQENCPIEIVCENELIREEKSIELFGDVTKKQPLIHSCINWCNIFGINTNDYIPKINITTHEKIWAATFCKRFTKPIIVFTPVCAGFAKDPTDARKFRTFPFEYWVKILDALSDKYDIIYCSKEDEYVAFNGKYTPVLNLDVRKTAALLNYSKLYLGIDTGVQALAVASGATIHTLVPTFSWGPNYYFPCFGYVKEMWLNEPCRSNYYLFQDWQRVISNLL